jgi:hypothetical protein
MGVKGRAYLPRFLPVRPTGSRAGEVVPRPMPASISKSVGGCQRGVKAQKVPVAPFGAQGKRAQVLAARALEERN